MNTVEIGASSTEESVASPSALRDWLGITASIGCAIHCAAMPFVFAYLPALGLSFLADESFHKWMALVCFLIALVAFIPGLRKHRNWTPVSVGVVGLILITFAAFGLAGECCPSCAAASTDTVHSASLDGADSCDDCDGCQGCSAEHGDGSESATLPACDEEKTLLSTLAPWITPVGGLLLVSAHLLNRRFGCLCGCC